VVGALFGVTIKTASAVKDAPTGANSAAALDSRPQGRHSVKGNQILYREFCENRLTTEIEHAGTKRSAEVRWH